MRNHPRKTSHWAHLLNTVSGSKIVEVIPSKCQNKPIDFYKLGLSVNIADEKKQYHKNHLAKPFPDDIVRIYIYLTLYQ